MKEKVTRRVKRNGVVSLCCFIKTCALREQNEREKQDKVNIQAKIDKINRHVLYHGILAYIFEMKKWQMYVTGEDDTYRAGCV